jgi:hypothetical protein
MTPEEKELVIEKLIENDEIRAMYDSYIIKEIPFKTWVRDTVDHLLDPVKPEISLDLEELLKFDEPERCPVCSRYPDGSG